MYKMSVIEQISLQFRNKHYVAITGSIRVSKRELSLRGMNMDLFCVRAKYGINNRQIITIGDFPSFPSVAVTDAFPPHRRSTRPPRRRSAPPSLARGHDVKRG
jgi:hypothetical protein